MTDNGEQLTCHLQRLMQDSRLERGTASERADGLRNILSCMQYATTAGWYVAHVQLHKCNIMGWDKY